MTIVDSALCSALAYARKDSRAELGIHLEKVIDRV
jgi:hypothetical protein